VGAVDTAVTLTQDLGAQNCTCCLPPIARFRYEQCSGGRSGTTHPAPFCGDGICDVGETVATCGADCYCGDGFCDIFELLNSLCIGIDCPGPLPQARITCDPVVPPPLGNLMPLSWSPDVVNLDATCSQWDPALPDAGGCEGVWSVDGLVYPRFLWDFQNDANWDLTTSNPLVSHEFPVLGFPTTVRLMVDCPTLEDEEEILAIEVGLASTYCDGCALAGSDLEPNPLDATPNPTCFGTAVQFDANATGGSKSYTKYEWDFDTDFVTFTIDAVAKDPVHNYAATGEYRAAVRVWDSSGCPSVWRAMPNDPIRIVENAIEFDDSNFVCVDCDDCDECADYLDDPPIPGNVNCGDSVDNDGDGRTDEYDCGDGVDNDADNLTDEVNCTDSIDNDGDSFTDEFNCVDGLDNDTDGRIDEMDPPMVELCGDGDTVVESGEEWEVTVQLKSNICAATDVRANLDLSTVTDVLATVQNNPGLFGDIPAGGTATYGYIIQPDPVFTKCGNGIDTQLTFAQFDLANIQSAEEPFYPPALSAINVQIGEPYPALLVTSFEDCADPPTSNIGNWTVINGGNKTGWIHDGPSCPSKCSNELFPTNYYVCDSNCWTWQTGHNEELISPVIDTSTASTVTLKFEGDYYNYAAPTSSDVNAQSSLTGGWVTLKDFAVGCIWWGDCAPAGTGSFMFDITGQCAGAADCQVEFHHLTTYYDSWWWAVDQVEVHRNAQCDLVPCGAAVRYDPSYDPTTSFVELCGDGDSVVEANEQWQVTVQLVNIGQEVATNVTADLAVGEATIENNPGTYGDLAPTETAQFIYTFCMSPNADCTNDLVFDVLNVQSNEGAHPAQPAVFTEPLGVGGVCNNAVACCLCECEANVDVVTVCLGDPQTFTGISNASCVTPVVYWWDFETDSIYDAPGSVVTHTYAVAGAYTATLRITDSDVPPTVTFCTWMCSSLTTARARPPRTSRRASLSTRAPRCRRRF
jgi:hypothetical protein